MGDLFFGSYTPKLSNATSHTLSQIFSGQAVLTRDLYGYAGASGTTTNTHALVREPLSGTGTTFEWQVVRQRDGNTAFSQETGVNGPSQSGYAANCFTPTSTGYPTVACDNPMNVVIGSHVALRSRVIGTGQMIAIANSTSAPDSLGYAFWSLGNFGNKNNIRYLSLDGSDALFPAWSTADGGHSGVFPGGVSGQGSSAILAAPASGQCGGYFNGDGGVTITSFSCNAYALPTFDGIQSGNYRFWNIVQANYWTAAAPGSPSESPLNLTGFILGAQNQANPVNGPLPDFFPVTYCNAADCIAQPTHVTHPLNYFRSHYTVSSWGIGNACNGVNSTCSPENGGDVAGAVTSVQTEQDFGSIFSNSLASWIQ